MDSQQRSLDALEDIRRMMQQSSRFLSLSGLSGVGAGCWALLGAALAYPWMNDFRAGAIDGEQLKWRLILTGLLVLAAAVLTSFYFTWRKARRDGLAIWDMSSRKLLTNLLIPLGTGGLFVIVLMMHHYWRLVVPACLIFYGLSLVNASKYTLRDIRVVGIIDIILGLVAAGVASESLLFWSLGFGVVHIVYGLFMWRKYDKQSIA